jgi:hypothetical protein
MSDRFVRSCLFAIVVLLAIIAFKPFLPSESVKAATSVEYVAVNPVTGNVDMHENPLLNRYGHDGWQLVAILPGTAYFKR